MDFNKKVMEANFPLLDKFRELAPGSYKHCQNVSNICENIAAELELDIDLLKCSALYHDVGKLNNPAYFSENQTNGTNMHDSLDPFISCQILTRHVGDSVLYLLQEPEIPKEIIPIISQHHGDTILQSIYQKSKGEPEDKYRYKCKKPETTETAILMIVDSVEATARALFNSKNESKKFITKAINDTIDRLIDDGQLDTMKIGVLKIVKKVLFKELESIYHKRLVYTEEEKTIAEIKKDIVSTKIE